MLDARRDAEGLASAQRSPTDRGSLPLLETRRDARDFIRAQTVLSRPILVPELQLHLITDACPLWRATERDLLQLGLADPYWAFAWPGGQVLARYVLDHPEVVRDQRVLDFGSGSGLVALAAALAGARTILASDLDPLAVEAIHLNAALAGTPQVEATTENLAGIDLADRFDVILAGDVLYEAGQARSLWTWLRAQRCRVLAGDPDRGHVPAAEAQCLATYDAPADIDVGGTLTRRARVLAIVNASPHKF